MKLAYQQLANEQEAALLKDLADLIAIDSVRDMSKATAEYPVGPGPVKALDKFLAFAHQLCRNDYGKVDFAGRKVRLNLNLLEVVSRKPHSKGNRCFLLVRGFILA